VAAAVLVAVTVWARPVYVPGRAESLLVPAALVVASLAVVKRRWQWLAVAVLGACGLATSLMSLVSWATAKPGPEARVARVLATGAGAGDVVVTTGWWLLGVQHALGADGAGLKWLTFPGESARHPGWYDDGWALPLAADEAPTFARRVEPTRDQGRRVWLVRTPALISDRLLDGVVHDLDLVPVAVEGELWSVWASPPESPGRGRQQ
jgi:hypothetical protein